MNCSRGTPSVAPVGSSSTSADVTISKIQDLQDSLDYLKSLLASETDTAILAIIEREVKNTQSELQTISGEYLNIQDSLIALAEIDLAQIKASGGTSEQIALAQQKIDQLKNEQNTADSTLLGNEGESSAISQSSNSQSSAATKNNPPVYTGTPIIEGNPIVDSTLVLNPVSTCTDPLDPHAPAPTMSYLWYYDSDSSGYNGTLISISPEYKVTRNNLDSYLYGILVCTDSENINVSDTTIYTPKIYSVNNAPIINQGDSISLQMDVNGIPNDFVLSLTAADLDSNLLIWNIATSPSIGTATAAGTGNALIVNYDASPNYVGVITFSVEVSDQFASDTIWVSVNINAVNTAPTLILDSLIVGIPQVGDTLSLNVQCSDQHHALLPTLQYQWLSNADSINFDGTSLIGTDSIYIIRQNDLGRHIIAIVNCVGESNSTVTLQTRYSAIITSTRAPERDGAIRFHGVDNYVDLPDYSIDWSNGLTVEAWVKWFVADEEKKLITLGYGGWNGQGRHIDLTNDAAKTSKVFLNLHNIECGNSDQNGWFVYGTQDGFIELNKWIHVAVVIDSSSIVFYKNGIMDITYASDCLPDSKVTYTNNTIGGRQSIDDTTTLDKYEHFFNGYFYEMRLWNKALSQAEILASYIQTFDGTEEGLLSFWNFNSKHGLHAYDLTDQYPGVLTNMDSLDSWGAVTDPPIDH